MLFFNLAPIFKARGIQRPYTFLVKAGISPACANRLINSDLRTVRLDHVELLCNLLFCEPNDLLLFTPDKGKQYPANSPLLKLVRQEADTPLQQSLANTPYKELKKISKAVLSNQSIEEE